jgi:peptide/nickel transport system substrate-binding protein
MMTMHLMRKAAGALPTGIVALALLSSVSTGLLAAEADTLVVARSMDINSLDPARAFCDTCQIYLTSVYDTLVTLDKDNKTVKPRLAKSWEISDNQTVFTFHLEPAAAFADGSPVEAKDVKWTFERLQNIKGSPSFFMDGLKSIDAKDKTTVVVTLDAPNGEFLNKLTAGFTGIINSTLATQNGATADAQAATSDKAETWFLSNSAGSGPFKLSAYQPDSELRLVRNDAYWAVKPGFDEVVFRQSQDAISQAQLLESGAADVAMQVDVDTASSLNSPEVMVETIPSYNFLYLALGAGAKGNKVPLTPDVRRAISLALDYEGVIEFTVGGQGNKQPAPVPNGFPGAAGLPERKRDLEAAKALLAKAGLADGFEVEAVYPNDNIYGVDINVMMQKVQQDLSEAGITVNLKPSTYPVWRDQLNGDGIPLTAVYYAPDYYGTGQYANYFGMIPGTSWSNRAGAKNDPSVINPKETELLQKALAAAPADQEKFYHELALEMMNDNIIIPLVSPNLVLAYRSDISGVRYSACCNLPLAEITRKK